LNTVTRIGSCLLCKSLRLEKLDGYGASFLAKCRDCSFVFCDRRPTEDELVSYYNQYPRGTALSPITLRRYEALCDAFAGYRKTNNILDVGCGDAHFLEIARKKNWNVFGTEFTEAAIEVCRNKDIPVFRSDLSTLPFEPGFFDVITSFEVIEHVNDPHESALASARLLRSGGILYVTTPNFNSLSRMMFGPKWNVIAYPEHLCYYDKKTIKKLFAGHGFSVLSVHTSGVSLERFRRSAVIRKDLAATQVDEVIRTRVEKNLFLRLIKASINFGLDLINKGDALKASFVKD
jgi:2-polyprenyl-3-methyl-5-hydroxy-6-metoxy-1,4-benzoquinol methylase